MAFEKVSVEEVSDVERRLTVIVPANQVEEEVSRQIGEFARKANIKGFRPGKVPLTYIKQRFGDDARKEALNEVMSKALYEAIVEYKLHPINTPRIEPKVVMPHQPLEFVVSFEILPKIEKIQFTMNSIEKLQVDIKPEDIDHVIGQLRKQHAKWQFVDRPAQETDRVVLDYYAIVDGKPDTENKVQNFPLELGSHVMLPGFEAGLIGSKAGEEKTLSLTFPNDSAMAERAGKLVDFVIQIKQVFAGDIPVVDENFVQRLGIKSGKEDDLREQIKATLEQERDRLVKEKLKEQIFTQLLEQNSLVAPPSLVAQEAKKIHDEMYPTDQRHDHHQHSATETASFTEIAKKRVSLGLLIAEYTKQADLQVDAERVTRRIHEIASVYQDPNEVIAWLSSKEQRGGVEGQVIEEQVMEKLIEGISVVNKTMSYGELKGIHYNVS